MWRETVTCGNMSTRMVFQSTPSVWRETHTIAAKAIEIAAISIHSLRVEGDESGLTSCSGRTISIHSLRVEGDQCPGKGKSSTKHFNPLPPCGGRPGLSVLRGHNPRFQSTPSVWRETAAECPAMPNSRFQSTPSVWRETLRSAKPAGGKRISIHSLRVEGDV